jgi:hypothetical protein
MSLYCIGGVPHGGSIKDLLKWWGELASDWAFKGQTADQAPERVGALTLKDGGSGATFSQSATVSEDPPPLLPAELVVQQQKHVTFTDGTANNSNLSQRGTLFVTNYRLIFRAYDHAPSSSGTSSSEQASPLDAPVAIAAITAVGALSVGASALTMAGRPMSMFSIPLLMVSEITRAKDDQASLLLRCKNLRRVRLSFDSSEEFVDG